MSSLKDRLQALHAQMLDGTPRWITPDRLSWARAWSVPIIYAAYMFVSPILASVLFALAAITDWIDGRLARHRQDFSPNGKRLDELTDKGFVLGILALLFIVETFHLSPRGWEFWISVGLIGREMLISFLREWYRDLAKKIPVLLLAQWKTGLLFVSLGFLILGAHEYFAAITHVGKILFVAAFVASIVSAGQYLFLFRKVRRGW